MTYPRSLQLKKLTLFISIVICANAQANVIYSLSIDGRPSKDVILIESQGRLYIDRTQLLGVNIDYAYVAPQSIHGCDACYRLDDIGTLEVNNLALRADLTIHAAIRRTRSYSLRSGGFRTTELSKSNGAYLNYLFFLTKAQQSELNYSLLVNSVIHTEDYGLFSHHETFSKETHQRHDTYWKLDDLDTNLEVIVGDTFNYSGKAGSSSRFGGFRIGTSYSDTAFNLYSSRSIDGLAEVKGEYQLFKDGRLISRSDIDAGHFIIDDIHPSGLNTYRLKLTGENGEVYEVEKTFISAPELLAEGIAQWGFSAGVLREDSTSYGDPIVSGFYRYGLNKYLTVEGSAEAVNDIFHIGSSADLATEFGVFSGSLAVGQDYGDTAVMAKVSHYVNLLNEDLYIHSSAVITENWHNVAGQEYFNEYRVGATYARPGWSVQVNTSTNEKGGTTLGFNFSTRIGDVFLNAGATEVDGQRSFSLGMSIPFGNGHSAGFAVINDQASQYIAGPITKSSRYALGNSNGRNIDETKLQLKYKGGTFSAEYNSRVRNKIITHSGRVRGALIVTDGSIMPATTVMSYAILDAGAPGVTVKYRGNQYITNSKGQAVVSVFPFTDQRVRVSTNNLPEGVTVRNTKAKFSVPTGYGTTVYLDIQTPGILAFPVCAQEGDEIKVDGKKFPYFEDVGAYIADTERSLFEAEVIREDKVIGVFDIDLTEYRTDLPEIEYKCVNY